MGPSCEIFMKIHSTTTNIFTSKIDIFKGGSIWYNFFMSMITRKFDPLKKKISNAGNHSQKFARHIPLPKTEAVYQLLFLM